jgi:hypothetical protein
MNSVEGKKCCTAPTKSYGRHTAGSLDEDNVSENWGEEKMVRYSAGRKCADRKILKTKYPRKDRAIGAPTPHLVSRPFDGSGWLTQTFNN